MVSRAADASVCLLLAQVERTEPSVSFLGDAPFLVSTIEKEIKT